MSGRGEGEDRLPPPCGAPVGAPCAAPLVVTRAAFGSAPLAAAGPPAEPGAGLGGLLRWQSGGAGGRWQSPEEQM